MKKGLFLVAAVLAAGCAAPETRYTPVPVKEPVNVYIRCDVPQREEPSWATKQVEPDSNIWEQSKALRAELEQREGFETQLKADISGCTAQPKPKEPLQ